MNNGQWDAEAVFSWALDSFTPADVLCSPVNPCPPAEH